MKYVTCIIKPFRLDALVQAIQEFPVESLMISHVRGYGRQKGHLHVYRESEYLIAFLPKVKIEFAAEDEHIEAILGRLISTARTGRIGDGKIFVQPVEFWASLP
ncbi:MAG: P-II family nitrogen regulator [Planctomycetes bacterium]|nr:P-II family nitrogen regulator [Planctomycetota bacterium]